MRGGALLDGSYLLSRFERESEACPVKRSILDGRCLEELAELDPDGASGLVNQLINLFLSTGPGVISDISSAVKAQDWKRAGEVAHKLKSTSGNLGALAMSDLAAEIEEACHSRQVDQDAMSRRTADLTLIFEETARALAGMR